MRPVPYRARIITGAVKIACVVILASTLQPAVSEYARALSADKVLIQTATEAALIRTDRDATRGLTCEQRHALRLNHSR